MSSTTPTSNPTQSWHIPEIITGIWTNKSKFINVLVPSKCTKCGTTRCAPTQVRNPTYGSIIRAYCTKVPACKEEYEDIRIQGENYKGGKSGGVAIPKEFFKPKFDPWVPDTRVGTGLDSTSGMYCTGKHCKGYNEFVLYAAPNQPDGKSFHCRRCRGIL